MNREPEISERFDINDIRRIREYNAARYLGMSPAEIVADTKAQGATGSLTPPAAPHLSS